MSLRELVAREIARFHDIDLDDGRASAITWPATLADRILAIPQFRELVLASQLLRDTDDDVIQIEVGNRRWLCRARSSEPSITTSSKG